MPIELIPQPQYIPIDDMLRLRCFKGKDDPSIPTALSWYSDKLTVLMSEGNIRPYTLPRLINMYEYQGGRGELYFIERLCGGEFCPIGDTALCRDDLPIVIAKEYRAMGIGRRVILALCERARALSMDRVRTAEIFDFNIPSIKCFVSAGFCPEEKTSRGHSYALKL